MLIEAIFIILSFSALFFAALTISMNHPLNSAMAMLGMVLAIAGLFGLLNASFLFMLQIIIYAGAVIALILFIIMFLNIKDEYLPKDKIKSKTLIPTILLLLPIDYMILNAISKLPKSTETILVTNDNFGTIKSIGDVLFKNWLLPFELISILLLVSLIGSIVLIKKER
jgi:NADH-quinone oxidoreductase subunit J